MAFNAPKPVDELVYAMPRPPAPHANLLQQYAYDPSHQISLIDQGRPSSQQRRQIGLFEVDCAGRFTVCEDGSGPQVGNKSTSSSVYAEIHSTPDENSVQSDDDTPDEADVEGILDPFDLGVLYTGSWQERKSCNSVFSWRVEAVTQEDFDEMALIESQKSQALYNGPVAERLKHSNDWKLGKDAPGSVTESTDYSVPGLTEGSSRETDTSCLPDRATHLEDNQMHSPVDNAFSFPDEITAGCGFGLFKSDLTLIGMFNERGESKDQGTQFQPYSVPRQLDAEGFPEVWIEQSQQNCNTSYEIPDLVSIHGGTGEDNVSGAADEESSESDSVWMSDYSESVPVLPDGHPFLLVKSKATEEALRLYEIYYNYTTDKGTPSATCVAYAGDNTSSGQAPRISSLVGSSSSSSGSKRASDIANQNGMDDNNDQNGADERGPPRKRVRASKQSAGREASLACPYAKKDPIKYRSCYSYTLKRAKDVKQHLSRCHQLPIYCARCKEIFPSEDERNEHLEVDISAICPVQNIVYDGVTREQKELLTRRVSHRMTLEDQWFSIFDILFPNHQPKPRSAYVNTDLTIEMETFQDMMVSEGPRIISTTLASYDIVPTSISSNPERDLSSLFDIVLMEALVKIADRWTANLVEDSTTNAENGDDSMMALASRAQANIEQSASSSDTLVTSRPNSQRPPLLFDRSLEETEAIASLPIRNNAPDRATNDEILPMKNVMSNELQESRQPRTMIEHTPNEFQTNPTTESQIPFSHPHNISDPLESQDLMLLDGLFEDHGLPGSWDNFRFEDETDEAMVNKLDNDSTSAYRDWGTPI
ncbi:unnamed protein product [Clonostachys rosea f. rosea IK726]|uniref:Uncharacterized protein n=1 Tax=Clonostachys rosea f. rosea IK726 TaxID=1349383 RepID=A0ACA9TGC4_BIOOC|nr:unnamed protein product [Clonostachys rosea f. rosea IK726]